MRDRTAEKTLPGILARTIRTPEKTQVTAKLTGKKRGEREGAPPAFPKECRTGVIRWEWKGPRNLYARPASKVAERRTLSKLVRKKNRHQQGVGVNRKKEGKNKAVRESWSVLTRAESHKKERTSTVGEKGKSAIAQSTSLEEASARANGFHTWCSDNILYSEKLQGGRTAGVVYSHCHPRLYVPKKETILLEYDACE